MSAAVLRAAATKLREAAEAARPSDGPWSMDQLLPEHRDYEHQANVYRDRGGPNYAYVCSKAHVDDATYIALANPIFGLAVADWLDAAANDGGRSGFALAVARSIVGGDE